MHGLRGRAKIYWGAIVLAATVLLALMLPRAGGVDGERLVLALVFFGLVALAKRFPLHLAPKTKLTLDSAVLFAALLLFAPAIAMALAAAGTLAAQAIRRQRWRQALFNSAQSVLRVGAAAVPLTIAGWDVGRLSLDRPEFLLALALAAGAMYALDTLIVATMGALQMGLSPLRVWRQSAGLGVAEELAQMALGLLAAAIVDVRPWTLPLFLLPALAIYRALERGTQLRQQTLEAVEALAAVVDLRDPYTAEHSRRVATVARDLAIALDLPPEDVETIERAARVHDVGKVGVDRAVLGKVGRLDEAEWAELKRHPVTGAEILGRFPQFARATGYVRHHHERVDGGGYPDGLRGEAIPLGARIIAVADALDAMTAARPYRPALPPERVVAELACQRGRQWDVRVVDALLALIDQGRVVLSPQQTAQAAPSAPPHRPRQARAIPSPK